jgi:tetratricopeptide (TPR) repeat protein
LYRHRGHRYISIRQFDRAIEDLSKAADLVKGQPLQVEPDGMPNKLNVPLSNSQFNIWYHLGLAFYLRGDYKKAASVYLECLKWSNNDDLLTATLDWLYMSYQRLGEKQKAAELLKKVHEKMKIIENQAYLSRLLMYKGLKSPESLLRPVKGSGYNEQLNLITQGYGVGNWYFYNGQTRKARKIFEAVIKGKIWSAFGYIAAEVDLARHFIQKNLEN